MSKSSLVGLGELDESRGGLFVDLFGLSKSGAVDERRYEKAGEEVVTGVFCGG